jgi:hypothetical protein
MYVCFLLSKCYKRYSWKPDHGSYSTRRVATPPTWFFYHEMIQLGAYSGSDFVGVVGDAITHINEELFK